MDADLHDDCNCLAEPRDIVDLKTWLFQACGGRLYRLLLLTQASAVLMGDGSTVETRLNTVERILAANTTMRFADTIAHRDSLTGWVPGDSCYVKDASADAAVGAGPALYIWLPELKWAKVWAMLDALNIIKKNGGLAVDEETGRIYVDFSRMPAEQKKAIASQLITSGGGVAVDDAGHLVLDMAGMDAARLLALARRLALASGGLAYDSDGRLYLNSAGMDAASRKAFLQGLVESGALVVNNAGKLDFNGVSLAGSGLAFEGGKLKVDFSSNDSGTRATISEMMATLHLPQYMTGNKSFYVDHAQAATVPGDDVARIRAGWGESWDKAFRSVQDCVGYVARNFNVGDNTATIYVKSGAYNESLTLTEFSRGTGRIKVVGSGGNFTLNTPVAAGARPCAISCRGGRWDIAGVTINYLIPLAEITLNATLSGVNVAEGAELHLRQHNYNMTLTGTAAKNLSFVGYNCSGQLYMELSDNGSSSFALTRPGSGPSVTGWVSEGNGVLFFMGDANLTLGDDQQARKKLLISGDFSYVAAANGGSIQVLQARATCLELIANPAVGGVPYWCHNGGSISGAEATYFPGGTDTEGDALTGIVEASTFSWFKK